MNTEEYAENFCRAKNLNLKEIKSKSRKADVVEQRVRLIKALRYWNFNTKEIGALINRDHSTVVVMSDDNKRIHSNKMALQRIKNKKFDNSYTDISC